MRTPLNPKRYEGSWRPGRGPHDAYALMEPPDDDDEGAAEFSDDDDDGEDRRPS